MTPLVAGLLVVTTALVVLRPFARSGAPAIEPVAGPLAGRQLLRQLRDLDEDLAAGKIGPSEHARQRAPVETAAAATLRPSSAPATTAMPAGPPQHRGRDVALALAVTAAVLGAGTVLLLGTVHPRTAGSTITGGLPQSGAPSTGAAAAAPTTEELATLAAAEARVRAHPSDVSAHLDLARDYATADQAAPSIVEYLAVVRLDPRNAEANTALALVAFQSGQAAQAKTLVDTALAGHPGYPEALYVRGLVELMGLKRPVDARRDLTAYLRAAPYGSHRDTVQTLLSMNGGTAP